MAAEQANRRPAASADDVDADAAFSRTDDETRLLMPMLPDPAVPASDATGPASTGPGLRRLPMALSSPPPPQPPPPAAASCSGRAESSAALRDFLFIKIVARFSLQVVRQFWAVSSAGLLAIVLFYWLCGGVMALLLVGFAVSGILYHASDRILYQPDAPATSRFFVPSPSTFGLQFESLYIKSKDQTRLHLFLIKRRPATATATATATAGNHAATAATLLFLHGNAGNIGHRLANAKGFSDRLHCNVCLLEYRGYGHSDGTPSEEGLYMDAQAALDFLCSGARSDVDTSRIMVFGRSLGGAVAIELASRNGNRDKISALFLENTFTSVPDMARNLFDLRLIRALPNWCYKNQFKSRWKVSRISVPVLFLSGCDDALVPAKMMTELYRSCGAELKRLARFPGGTHNDTWTKDEYYHTVKYFAEEVVKLCLNPSANAMAISRHTTTPPTVLVSDNANIV